MKYTVPDIEIIIFESADIVRTSGKDVEWDPGWDNKELGEQFA